MHTNRFSPTRWLVACLMAACAAWVQAAPTAPSPIAPTEARAIRAVIQAQLDAFAAEDPQRAFALATPAIRQQFGTAELFIEMVRSGYPVVYRPARVSFLQPERDGTDVLQRVQMTDAAGRAWVASYRMERQADKRWLIGGCEVTEAQGRFTGLLRQRQRGTDQGTDHEVVIAAP